MRMMIGMVLAAAAVTAHAQTVVVNQPVAGAVLRQGQSTTFEVTWSGASAVLKVYLKRGDQVVGLLDGKLNVTGDQPPLAEGNVREGWKAGHVLNATPSVVSGEGFRIVVRSELSRADLASSGVFSIVALPVPHIPHGELHVVEASFEPSARPGRPIGPGAGLRIVVKNVGAEPSAAGSVKVTCAKVGGGTCPTGFAADVEVPPLEPGATKALTWYPSARNAVWPAEKLRFSVTGQGGPTRQVLLDAVAINPQPEPPGSTR